MCKDLFKTIDSTIRSEALYANVNLMREDVMRRFGITRHHLNDLLNAHADGMTFPQYINAIRMEKAYGLINRRLEMSIAEIARKVGFTAPNLREQFKRMYGLTPTEYRAMAGNMEYTLNEGKDYNDFLHRVLNGKVDEDVLQLLVILVEMIVTELKNSNYSLSIVLNGKVVRMTIAHQGNAVNDSILNIVDDQVDHLYYRHDSKKSHVLVLHKRIY